MTTPMKAERNRKGKAPALIDSSGGRRKPLSDCSNILAARKSSSIIIPKPPSDPVLFSPSRTRKIKTSTVALNRSSRLDDPASIPRTPLPVSGRNKSAVFEPRSVYTRRQTAEKRKDKGKAFAVPVPLSTIFKRLSSLQQLKKRVLNRDDLSGERSRADVSGERVLNKDDLSGERADSVTKSRSKPRVKKSRDLSFDKESSKSLEEYIRKQKLYFEEVDAFELPVKEASDEELE